MLCILNWWLYNESGREEHFKAFCRLLTKFFLEFCHQGHMNFSRIMFHDVIRLWWSRSMFLSTHLRTNSQFKYHFVNVCISYLLIVKLQNVFVQVFQSCIYSTNFRASFFRLTHVHNFKLAAFTYLVSHFHCFPLNLLTTEWLNVCSISLGIAVMNYMY